jgi:hypothetical protein
MTTMAAHTVIAVSKGAHEEKRATARATVTKPLPAS